VKNQGNAVKKMLLEAEFGINMNEHTQKGSYPEDDYQIRCPKLGHQIQFAHCRIEQGDFPFVYKCA
jgi:hypothetical protein